MRSSNLTLTAVSVLLTRREISPGDMLSENPVFARICERRNIKFIGPRSLVIEKLGNKTQARATMIQAGVPVTPGSDGNLADIDEAIEVAKNIGYPVMLKATSGGGGRGIRLCANETDLKNNFPRVISEQTYSACL